MADVMVIGATLAAAGAALASAVAAMRSGRGDRELGSVVSELAASSTRQAEAMRRLADLSAESMRAATGTFVFQLRDRFDESFPPVQLGVSASSWSAVGDAPGLVEELVFHAGDRVSFVSTLVCNQAPLRRDLRVHERPTAVDEWSPRSSDAPSSSEPGVGLGPVRFHASASRSSEGSRFAVPPDLSVFVDVPVEIEVAVLGLGPFQRTLSIDVTCTDTRPEGVLSTLPVDIRVFGVVVADEDGYGLDALAVEADIGLEHREYFLDKTHRLPLTLPVVSVG